MFWKKELLEVISEFDTLEGFLQHVSLMTDNDAGNELGEVTLMTLHAAKGSEYQVIFIGPKLTATGSKLKFVN